MSTGAIPKTAKKRVTPRHLSASEKESSEKPFSLNSSKKIGNCSQDSSMSQNGQGMTSTPASKAFPFHPFDASVVTDSHGFALPSEGIVSLKPISVRRNQTKGKSSEGSSVSHSPSIATLKDTTGNDSFERWATAEMDLLYAEYLQLAFLESEAKSALERRSAEAVETLHKMLTLIQHYMDKVKSKRTYMMAQSFLIEAHKHCEKQEAILKPVFEILPAVKTQYESLANAVNANKHKMPVENVTLPDPDETLNALEKMKEFLSSFLDAVPSHKDIVSSSDKLQKFVDAAELLTDALKRGIQLLEDSQELHLAAASLALGSED